MTTIEILLFLILLVLVIRLPLPKWSDPGPRRMSRWEQEQYDKGVKRGEEIIAEQKRRKP